MSVNRRRKSETKKAAATIVPPTTETCSDFMSRVMAAYEKQSLQLRDQELEWARKVIAQFSDLELTYDINKHAFIKCGYEFKPVFKDKDYAPGCAIHFYVIIPTPFSPITTPVTHFEIFNESFTADIYKQHNIYINRIVSNLSDFGRYLNDMPQAYQKLLEKLAVDNNKSRRKTFGLSLITRARSWIGL